MDAANPSGLGHVSGTWLLEMLRHHSDRKLRLVACGLCRTIWHELSPLARETVEVGEGYADKLITNDMRTLQFARMRVAGGSNAHRPELWLPACTVVATGRDAAEFAVGAGASPAVEVAVMRDIFATAFQPVELESAWLTSDVLALARGIYDDRAFDRMPILADALQDAGCTNEDVLSHCRSNGPHVRGCWVVDLLLEKA